jgi:hypothetical protein
MMKIRLFHRFGKPLKCSIIVLIVLTTAGCEKSIFDFRYKYVGDWDFKVISAVYLLNGQEFHDTVFYQGQISYGSNKNELHVIYSTNFDQIISINKDGTIPESWEVSGRFDDKNHLTLMLRTPQSSLGMQGVTNITGTR